MYNQVMASWIVHLRLAEDLLRLLPALQPIPFAIGNVAPDSGIPDKNWENFDPPTEVTHFSAAGMTEKYTRDLDFFRRYLLPLRNNPDEKIFSFRLGYFFHLLTDNLWHQKIGLPTKRKFQDEFARDRDFIWEVKKDWYGLDFIYLRYHPDCLFWEIFLDVVPETGGLEFLLEEGVRHELDHIKQYYQRTDEKVQSLYNRPYIYLSQEDVDRFVAETTARLVRIYNCVWTEAAATDGFVSAIDLVQ